MAVIASFDEIARKLADVELRLQFALCHDGTIDGIMRMRKDVKKAKDELAELAKRIKESDSQL